MSTTARVCSITARGVETVGTRYEMRRCTGAGEVACFVRRVQRRIRVALRCRTMEASGGDGGSTIDFESVEILDTPILFVVGQLMW